MAALPSRVKLVDVGPRDGLQNEKQPVAGRGQDRAGAPPAGGRPEGDRGHQLRLARSGCRRWPTTPQVMAGIAAQARRALLGADAEHEGLRGGAVGAAAWPDEVVVFGAASEAFSQRNINCSIAESIERFRAGRRRGARARASRCAARSRARSAARTRARSRPTRSSAWCALMKEIGVRALRRRRHHRRRHAAAGAGGDGARAEALSRSSEVSGHFHDTYGQALANIYAALELGIATFDASVAGLGGCPYAKGATGNVATEDVLFMLERAGHRDRHRRSTAGRCRRRSSPACSAGSRCRARRTRCSPSGPRRPRRRRPTAPEHGAAGGSPPTSRRTPARSRSRRHDRCRSKW